MNENTQDLKHIENQKKETITLSLNKNIKTIVIDGIRFEMDLDNPDVFKALLEFKEDHNDHPANIETDVDGLLADCADVIDTVPVYAIIAVVVGNNIRRSIIILGIHLVHTSSVCCYQNLAS